MKNERSSDQRLETLEAQLKAVQLRLASLERRSMRFAPLKNMIRNLLKDRL